MGLTLKSARNPRWIDETRTVLVLNVEFNELDIGESEFVAASYDVEKHSIDLFDSAVSGEFGIIAPFEPETKEALLNYAKHIRGQLESGGITVDGLPIATDERAKNRILLAAFSANTNSEWRTVWQCTDGFGYGVGAATMIRIAEAVADHIETCFARYYAVKGQVDAGLISTRVQVAAAMMAL